jgi:hypothetical protein
MEFLRNFYAVFPEYKTTDVGSLNSIIDPDPSAHGHQLDLHSRRELRWAVYSLFL